MHRIKVLDYDIDTETGTFKDLHHVEDGTNLIQTLNAELGTLEFFGDWELRNIEAYSYLGEGLYKFTASYKFNLILDFDDDGCISPLCK